MQRHFDCIKELTMLFCVFAFWQSSFGQSIKFGVTAGVNSSTFYPQNYYGVEPGTSITGFHAGAFAELKLGNLAIQPGLNYSSIGGNDGFSYSNASGAAGDGSYQFKVQYLQVPVNVLYNVPVAAGSLFFGGGPYVGFGLSGKANLTGLNTSIGYPTFETNQSSNYAFSKADNPDFGAIATAGIRLKNGLLFSFSYQYGLKFLANYQVTSAAYNYPYSVQGVKNNIASISVGYEFF